VGLFRPHTSLVPEDRPLRAVSPRNSRVCRAVLFLEMNVSEELDQIRKELLASKVEQIVILAAEMSRPWVEAGLFMWSMDRDKGSYKTRVPTIDEVKEFVRRLIQDTVDAAWKSEKQWSKLSSGRFVVEAGFQPDGDCRVGILVDICDGTIPAIAFPSSPTPTKG
jgi:hypothetical protein